MIPIIMFMFALIQNTTKAVVVQKKVLGEEGGKGKYKHTRLHKSPELLSVDFDHL